MSKIGTQVILKNNPNPVQVIFRIEKEYEGRYTLRPMHDFPLPDGGYISENTTREAKLEEFEEVWVFETLKNKKDIYKSKVYRSKVTGRWGYIYDSFPAEQAIAEKMYENRDLEITISNPEKLKQYLELSKKFIKNTTSEELEDLMSEFDNYEVENYGQKAKVFKKLDNLLAVFEKMQGITSEDFEEKDWYKFERFIESHQKEITEEKLYTKQDLEEAHQMGAIFAYGKKEATREERLEHFNNWLYENS